LLNETPERVHGMIRSVGKIFTDAFKHNPRLAMMMVTILSDRAVEHLPGTSQQAKPTESAAVARVRMILQMNDEERVQSLTQEGNALFDELGALHEGELMRTLLGSLTGLMLDRLPRKRLSVARSLNSLRRGLERSATADTEDAFEQAVRTSIDVER